MAWGRRLTLVRLGVGMRMVEAMVDCLSISLLHHGFIKPSAEREPESAFIVSNKLVHPQRCVHLDPGMVPASGLIMFLDGCILNVTQECWSPLKQEGGAALPSICSTNHETMFPPSKMFCQTSQSRNFHCYIYPFFRYMPTMIKASFSNPVLLIDFILIPSNGNPILRKGNCNRSHV